MIYDVAIWREVLFYGLLAHFLIFHVFNVIFSRTSLFQIFFILFLFGLTRLMAINKIIKGIVPEIRLGIQICSLITPGLIIKIS